MKKKKNIHLTISYSSRNLLTITRNIQPTFVPVFPSLEGRISRISLACCIINRIISMALQYREIFRISFVIVGRAAAYDGFVLKLELPCRLRVSVVSYCGLLAFDARDAWPQTGGSLIESGEDSLCHCCKPCFVNAKPLIPSNRIVLPFPEEKIIISFQLVNQ